MPSLPASPLPRDGLFRLLVTVHSVLNVPVEISALPPRGATFIACVRPSKSTIDTQRSSGPLRTVMPFSPAEVIERNGILQVVSPKSCEWVVAPHKETPTTTIGITADILERRDDAERGRSLCSVQGTLDLREVLDRKMLTRIIGTSCGQIGVTFEVSPNDSVGYVARLEAFLREHHPKGVAQASTIAQQAPELLIFTALYKKYHLIDYRQRTIAFFEMYGPEMVPRTDETLKEWHNKEEEFLRSLVLDNGPEPQDIEPRARLAAFAECYRIDLDIERLLEEHRGAYERLFAKLRAEHGQEPDPRSYLYPAVSYPPLIPNDGSTSTRSDSQRDPQPLPPRGSQPTPMQPRPRPVAGESVQSRAVSVEPQQQQSQTSKVLVATVASPPKQRTGTASDGPPQLGSSAPPSHSTPRQPTAADPRSPWELLKSLVATPSDLFFKSPDAFASMLDASTFPASVKAELTTEWRRRVQEALTVGYVTSGEQHFDAVRKEVVALSGLDAINITVAGIMSLRNVEHETAFNACLARARSRSVDRVLIIGDYARLMEAAKHGVQPATLSGSTKQLDFPRKPFLRLEHACSVAALICDVILGRSAFVPSSSSPADSVAALPSHSDYDSIVTGTDATQQSVAVFSPQQLLPRYLVHCNVDPALTPCPAHPTRPVEYFVVHPRVFACSLCVVVGIHRGAEVITVEQSIAEARTRLSDAQREADRLLSEFASAEADAQRALDELLTGTARHEVELAAEEIKRDAERRAARLLADFDADLSKRKAQAKDTRDKITQSKAELQKAAVDPIAAALRSSNPLLVLRTQSEIAPSVDFSAWRAHADEAKAAAVACLTGDADGLRTASHNASRIHQPPLPQRPLQPEKQPTPFSPIPGSRIIRSDAFTTAQQQHPRTSVSAPWASRAEAAAAAAAAHEVREASLRDPPTGVGVTASLYDKFMHLKGANFLAGASSFAAPPQQESHSSVERTAALPQRTPYPNHVTPSVIGASARGPPQAEGEQALSGHDLQMAKEQLAKGWAAYRGGDRAAAHQHWMSVFENYGNSAVSARARAYIAEAIEKDIDRASQWYERALRYDPNDAMTLFNYGVMLEGAKKTHEAIALFDSAARLGDSVAFRRAESLRRSSIGA